jgi:hypothetical protein
MKLDQLQRALQAHVLYGDATIRAEIAGDERFPTTLRLGVYSDAYSARLVEVLAQTFPALQQSLGSALFARLISQFVREQPSRVRSARDYGAHLPQWFADRLKGPRARGCSDLARFEWAMAGAFDAQDAAPLVPQDLAGVQPAQWPQLRFTFTQSLRRLTVSSNCVNWWRYACAQQARPTRWRDTCPQHWLVWRQDLAVFYRRLSQAEARALDAALAGHSFGELCEALSDPAAAAGLLHRWFSEGLVVKADAAAGPQAG